LPDAVPMALGSAFFSPCTSAWVALHEVGRVRAGERVLVTGATGAVGSIAVQLAREAGADVRAVVTSDAQAARLPAQVPAADIDDLGPQSDLLIDTVGGAVLPAALRGVAPGGRAVLVGYTGGTTATSTCPSCCNATCCCCRFNMLRREAAGRRRHGSAGAHRRRASAARAHRVPAARGGACARMDRHARPSGQSRARGGVPVEQRGLEVEFISV
jgi:NADPH2:quinone reductase